MNYFHYYYNVIRRKVASCLKLFITIICKRNNFIFFFLSDRIISIS